MEWLFWALIFLVPATLFDLWLLLHVSSSTGLLLTLFSQIPLCGYGWWRLRKLDGNTLFFVAAERQKGEPIIKELWDEVLQILGAWFLLVPGWFNSLIGLILLFRQSRLLLLEIIYYNR